MLLRIQRCELVLLARDGIALVGPAMVRRIGSSGRVHPPRTVA
jgi:hypothetical protein